MRYEPGNADRAGLPAGYETEPRYPGYRESDLANPYAKYFETATRPVLEHVVHALVAGKAPADHGYGVDEVVDRLARPGYEHLETGWTRLDSGVRLVAVHTPMPGVTAAMWDWWFAWQAHESARYKLWHPDDHRFCAVGEDRRGDRSLTDQQRYIDNVTYADEYVGGQMNRLAIRFLDPHRMGFASAAGTTHICARVSLSTHPVAIGWLVHQIRPTDDGAEMRSRFFLGDADVLDLPARSLPDTTGARSLTTPLGRAIGRATAPWVGPRMLPTTTGTDMLQHCAAEMNHLAGFLPRLYEEFHDTP